jgi:ribosomal protein S18 acetylase RimI-like enzyme
MIEYRETTKGINPAMLEGFFVGWKTPHTPETHLEILEKSAYIVLAIDRKTNKVIGFITAITDSVQSAFIPLLEVLPEYQNQNIGSSLVKRMLEKLNHIYAIDLMCDGDLQGFYQRLGMMPSVGMVVRNY